MAAVKLTTPSLTCHHCKSSSSKKPGSNITQKPQQEFFFTRRSVTVSALAAAFIATRDTPNPNAAAFELRFTVPDQTVEEADDGVKGHAQDLLQIKTLIDSESWREAQIALRESSAYLKQDLYTIIQGKPGSQRPLLRKLYSHLFDNVARLDYAARSKEPSVAKECYDNIVAILTEIFTRI